MCEFNKDKYDQQYKKDHFDLISFFAPKGTKDKIKALASAQGVSNSEFMRQLVINAINEKAPTE